MVTFKIASSGMKGRKKDTILLLLVIALSFMFIVSATMFYAGIADTEDKNRVQTYGKWQAAYMAGDLEDVAFLKKVKDIDKVSVNGIVDESTSIGVLGTIDENFPELGNIKLAYGQLPNAENEILLEMSKASELGYGKDDIGKNIAVTSEMVTGVTEQLKLEQFTRRNPYVYQYIEYTPIYTDDNLTVSYKKKMLCVNERPEEEITFESESKNAIITSAYVTIHRKYKLVGIIDTYSDRWYAGKHVFANAFISQSDVENYTQAYEKCILPGGKKANIQPQKITYNTFLYSNKLNGELYNTIKYQVYEHMSEKANNNTTIGEDKENFIRNLLSYPENINQQKQNLIFTVMTAIFLISAVAILQLYLTQVRRRARTFSLLKSIGATNRQVICIFIFESLFLLLIGMPIGVGLGVGFSNAASAIIISSGGILTIGFIPSLTLIGVGACCMSLFTGMIAPMIYALNIPLTGVIEKPLKHRKDYGSRKDFKLLLEKISPAETISMITTTHERLNRGKTVMTFVLSLMACTLICFSILLGYVCHGDYINQVKDKGKPDYEIEYLYGIGRDNIGDCMYPINRITGIDSATVLWRGEGLHLYYDGISYDKIVGAFKQNVPELYRSTYFASDEDPENQHMVNKALITNFYGVPVGKIKGLKNHKSILEKIEASITEGKVNYGTFNSGSEVVLVLPMYMPLHETSKGDTLMALQKAGFQGGMASVLESAGKFKLSLSRDDYDIMTKSSLIRLGDEIWLSVDEEKMVGEDLFHIFNPIKVRVSGIIRYFKRESVWPFSQTNQPYAVIGSESLMSKLYAGFNNDDLNSLDKNQLRLLTKTTSKVRLGRTLFYINTNSKASLENTDIPLIDNSKEQGFIITNYRNSNQIILAEAKNNTAIVALLCVTSSVLALIILFNILSSSAEQEKKRFGILQAIGITRKQLWLVQLKTAIRNGLASIALAHIIFGGAICIIVVLTKGRTGLSLSSYVNRMGRYYPIKLHIEGLFIYLIAIITMYCLPFRRIIRSSPVENINE